VDAQHRPTTDVLERSRRAPFSISFVAFYLGCGQLARPSFGAALLPRHPTGSVERAVATLV